MEDRKRNLIFGLFAQLAKSKTVAANVLIVGVVTTYLKFKGVTLTPEETEIAFAAAAVAISGINIVLRFFTKKPLMEKTKLLE